jgi:probable HAF family extracellular repeat protein
MLDLNDLITNPVPGFTLADATGISDTGYITGTGTTSNGQFHAFLLTPVPEPCGLVLLGTGAVSLLGYTVRRRTPAFATRTGGPEPDRFNRKRGTHQWISR